MVLEGIDVSSYQGSVGWRDVRQAGKSFAFCKATEGAEYRDPYLSQNWQGLGQNSIVRGAYHFLHPSLSGDVQADYFHEAVRESGGFRGGDFAVVDVEIDDAIAPEYVIECAALFVERTREQTGRNVILYTYPAFWVDTLGDPKDPVLARCPLWLADYGPSVPTLANWPGGLAFWQFTDTGHCPGVNGQVDLDRFYGSRQQLHQLAQP